MTLWNFLATLAPDGDPIRLEICPGAPCGKPWFAMTF
jgi:hypothetical protein